MNTTIGKIINILALAFLSQNLNFCRLNILPLNPGDFFNFYKSQNENASSKLVFYTSRAFHDGHCSKFGSCGVLLETNTGCSLSSFGFKNRNFVLSDFNEIFDRLLSSGIPQARWDGTQKIIVKPEESPPFVLSIDDLIFAFVVWLIACGVSSAVFLLEIISIWISRVKEAVRGMIGVFYIFKFIRRMRFY